MNARVSIGLVTRNRPCSLARTLISVREQSVQPWEVIVSDDSDTSVAVEKVVKCCNKYDAHYIRGPMRGLYANRNCVAVACSGTHIRTMDDDHEFPENHFALCNDAIESDSASIWIIGERIATDDHAYAPELNGEVPSPGQLHPRGFSVTPPDTQNCWSISDGGTIYPRQVFESGNRFFESFKFGASYLEFGSRLHWLGYRMRFLTSTYLIHHFDPANRSFAQAEMEIAARTFASLCHSFIYQPTLKNRLLTCAECFRQALFSPAVGSKAVVMGWRAFKERRLEYRSL